MNFVDDIDIPDPTPSLSECPTQFPTPRRRSRPVSGTQTAALPPLGDPNKTGMTPRMKPVSIRRQAPIVQNSLLVSADSIEDKPLPYSDLPSNMLKRENGQILYPSLRPSSNAEAKWLEQLTLSKCPTASLADVSALLGEITRHIRFRGLLSQANALNCIQKRFQSMTAEIHAAEAITRDSLAPATPVTAVSDEVTEEVLASASKHSEVLEQMLAAAQEREQAWEKERAELNRLLARQEGQLDSAHALYQDLQFRNGQLVARARELEQQYEELKASIPPITMEELTALRHAAQKQRDKHRNAVVDTEDLVSQRIYAARQRRSTRVATSPVIQRLLVQAGLASEGAPVPSDLVAALSHMSSSEGDLPLEDSDIEQFERRICAGDDAIALQLSAHARVREDLEASSDTYYSSSEETFSSAESRSESSSEHLSELIGEPYTDDFGRLIQGWTKPDPAPNARPASSAASQPPPNVAVSPAATSASSAVLGLPAQTYLAQLLAPAVRRSSRLLQETDQQMDDDAARQTIIDVCMEYYVDVHFMSGLGDSPLAGIVGEQDVLFTPADVLVGLGREPAIAGQGGVYSPSQLMLARSAQFALTRYYATRRNFVELVAFMASLSRLAIARDPLAASFLLMLSEGHPLQSPFDGICAKLQFPGLASPTLFQIYTTFIALLQGGYPGAPRLRVPYVCCHTVSAVAAACWPGQPAAPKMVLHRLRQHAESVAAEDCAAFDTLALSVPLDTDIGSQAADAVAFGNKPASGAHKYNIAYVVSAFAQIFHELAASSRSQLNKALVNQQARWDSVVAVSGHEPLPAGLNCPSIPDIQEARQAAEEALKGMQRQRIDRSRPTISVLAPLVTAASADPDTEEARAPYKSAGITLPAFAAGIATQFPTIVPSAVVDVYSLVLLLSRHWPGKEPHVAPRHLAVAFDAIRDQALGVRALRLDMKGHGFVAVTAQGATEPLDAATAAAQASLVSSGGPLGQLAELLIARLVGTHADPADLDGMPAWAAAAGLTFPVTPADCLDAELRAQYEQVQPQRRRQMTLAAQQEYPQVSVLVARRISWLLASCRAQTQANVRKLPTANGYAAASLIRALLDAIARGITLLPGSSREGAVGRAEGATQLLRAALDECLTREARQIVQQQAEWLKIRDTIMVGAS